MEQISINDSFHSLKTREDVARILNISEQSLRYFLYKLRLQNKYHSFTIAKKDGSLRIISAPDERLKSIQRKLSLVLSSEYSPKSCVYGFLNDKSFIDNARNHIAKRIILNIDLKDFFDQIHFGRVLGMLVKPPYSLGREAAITITQIACYNGHLPQGSPCSPIITNMICAPLDNAMMRLAKKTGCYYSRYADDITFSTYRKEFDKGIVLDNNGTIELGDEIKRILSKHSFIVNPKKVSLKTKDCRQEVTGITVNERLNPRRSYTKQLRAILHHCERDGVLNAVKQFVEKGLCKNESIKRIINDPEREKTILSWFSQVLIGKINYLRMIKGDKNLTFLSYAKKYNEVFQVKYFDITELDRFNVCIDNNTFILKGQNTYTQGSGFYLPGYGLITAYHVTEDNDFYTVNTVKSYEGNPLAIIGKALNEISADKDLDYALYKIPSDLVSVDLSFSLGDSEKLRTGDTVILIGYPNYMKGDSPNIQHCFITSKKQFMGAEMFTVSGRVVHGSSGGIVLDSDHNIVGIIKGGIVSMEQDDQCENQGFVPIHLVIEHLGRKKQLQTER